MLLDSASDVGNRVSSGGWGGGETTQLHGPWQLHTDQSVEWRPSAVQDVVKS